MQRMLDGGLVAGEVLGWRVSANRTPSLSVALLLLAWSLANQERMGGTITLGQGVFSGSQTLV